MESTAWSTNLTVEVAGHGVVLHAGSAAVRLIADRTGLTEALSKALARRGFVPVHGRGRVLTDTAVLIADGGTVLSDLLEQNLPPPRMIKARTTGYRTEPRW